MTFLTPEILNLVFAACGGFLVHLWHRQHPVAAPAVPAPPLLSAELKPVKAAPAVDPQLASLISAYQELQAEASRSKAHGLLQDLATLAKAKQAAAPGQVLQLPASFHLPS